MGQSIPIMTPPPGERLLRFVGDRVRFTLQARDGRSAFQGWRARLRTDLGRADTLRREIIQAHTRGVPIAGASWRDLPMNETDQGWSLDLPLAEPGYFQAKAYLLDPKGWQHWPEGPNTGISVHPNAYRTANTIYCAFPRLFGPTRGTLNSRNDKVENQIAQIEQHGYTIIPPSGKLRDLIECLPHITDVLGCRIVHLLPVNPTPTTYARFGRFGSPYAALDLTAIDPALVVFDKRTTGIDQFRELTYATHLRGSRVVLDIVINHTGWGSTLQENQPQWFLRQPDGTFVSPGAWGTTWEDLVELKHDNVALWDKLAEMFLTWCRRGVDGFRCDAGYKVPVPAWQYIIARVQQEFPETLFLLEGLGGAWETTAALLTNGGMQWAYSELFQNYSAVQVAGYLDHSIKQSERVGLLVHYSETHDNERLAAGPPAELLPKEKDSSSSATPTPAARRGRAWSLLRNHLCALTSVNGGFGFTCGVEWLANEKIKVHGSTGLAWANTDNLIPELARLNRLLAEHPCFFDAAKLTRISPTNSPVYALLRQSAEGRDAVLVLVNLDIHREQTLALDEALLQKPAFSGPAEKLVDLLSTSSPRVERTGAKNVVFTLAAGSCHCLAATTTPQGLSGNAYREQRARAAWGLQALSKISDAEKLGDITDAGWISLAQEIDSSPTQFLAALAVLAEGANAWSALPGLMERCRKNEIFPKVVVWTQADLRRITLVPPEHWLLIGDTAPFRASLTSSEGSLPQNVQSIAVRAGHIAYFAPRQGAADARLRLERYAEADQHVEAAIRFLAPVPENPQSPIPNPQSLVLLTNGIGGMARLCVDLGRVNSKYDCVLGANLHPSLPVDRHVFAKRIRVWVNAAGFIAPLDFKNLVSFDPGPPAAWRFAADAGDGRVVEIVMRADMAAERNTTVFRFRRLPSTRTAGKTLPADTDVRLTVRVDIEDRNFHSETHRNSGAEHHFSSNTREIRGQKAEGGGQIGFAFTPSADRQLRVFAYSGEYHSQPEWCEHIPHPLEQSRGQVGEGDAYSPGWFELPLTEAGAATLVVTAEPAGAVHTEATDFKLRFEESGSAFESQLFNAARSFVVRRDHGRTVIAGYPWFLDWGRDTFICARGLLSAGMTEEVKEIVLTFARFEKGGTLPNIIHGEDASNRDTSDAPLWFGVVCEELAGSMPDLYSMPVSPKGRTIREVLQSIALNYFKGTPNGIRTDTTSALIWSPSHFTWMDTNYPAGTPREGFPIEIQALWIRLLRQLGRISDDAEIWKALANQALASAEKLFWLEDRGYYADVLIARPGQSAAQGIASDALRSNCLLLVSLGLAKGERAKRTAAAALRNLVVPGALRSLAPLPVSVPLPIYSNDGRLLNNPGEPYWGRYEGDEDTRRKPAYHNGTAWTWTFAVFCEALARAWNFSPEAVAAARAYLGSMDQLLAQGCIGQIPEVLDGDAPHQQRGCDAQAWGATEALRVWKLLKGS
jgi:predicted glycogen debranching enzyme